MKSLPVLNVAALFSGEDCDAVLEQHILKSVQTTGGFVVAGFPGATSLARRGERLLRFFDLPQEAKQAVATRETNPESRNIYRGYISLLGGGDFALNEMYDIGPVEPVPGPNLPGMPILSEREQWPDPEPFAGWRDEMRLWYQDMERLGRALLVPLARAVGVDLAPLQALFEQNNSTLRLLNYPSVGGTTAAEEGRTSKGPALLTQPHTDGSGLSLLWQSDSGLQAQGPDGIWREIPALPQTVSVHLGDVLDKLTDGRLPPTPHRVTDQGTPRRSIGFFLEPGLNAPMRSLDLSGQPCPPTQTYGAQLLARLRTYPGMGPLIPTST